MAPRDAAARARDARIRELQRTGFRGGRIAPHRAMIGLTPSWGLLVDVGLLPALQLLALALLRDPITAGWRRFLETLAGPLGMPGGVTVSRWGLGPLEIPLPAIAAPAAWPATPGLLAGWLVTLGLALAGVLIRGAYTPLAYMLRAMAVVQLTAQLWFTFASPPFTYTLPGYQHAVFYLGTVVLFLVPIGAACTYNIFDFRLWQKLALTGMVLAHLVVLLPLQVATHAYLIHRLTLLAMPILYLLFGLLLHVFVFVALYGWGMSWRSGGELDAGDRRPPTPAPAGTPDAPSGDPEIGRRAQAAREAAALAAALGAGPRPAAPAPAMAAPAPPAPARPAPARPATTPLATTPLATTPLATTPLAAVPAGAAQGGAPRTSATPAAGTPAVGTPAMGTPAMGTPAMGTPAKGTPAIGTPRVVPPRGSRAVPLVFGKPVEPAPPPLSRRRNAS